MSLRIVTVPYYAGHRSVSMGLGPEYMVENGLTDALEAINLGVEARTVELEAGFAAEVSAAFELDRLISEEVCSGVAEGKFPLVLSGNCNNSLGTVAGVGGAAVGGAAGTDVGIVWLDGHADFHTPETTTSGFTDCMGLSALVGHCWKAMSSQVPGYEPVPEENVILVGAREVEPGEHKRLQASDVALISPAGLKNRDFFGELDSALAGLRERVRAVYLHLDLDVLDPASVGKANEYAPPGGLTVEEAEQTIRAVRERVEIYAAGIASYDPTLDQHGSVLQAGTTLAKCLVD